MSNERRLSHTQRSELDRLRRATNGLIANSNNHTMNALERKGFARRSDTSAGATIARPVWLITPAGIERLEKAR